MSKYIKDLTFETMIRNGLIEVSSDTPEVVCITDPMITANSSDEEDLVSRLPFTLDVEIIGDKQARIHLTIDVSDIMDTDSDRIKDLLKEEYDRGYEEGQEIESDRSYNIGYDAGYSDGQDEGKETGYRNGYNEAEEEYREKMAEMKSEYEDTIAELEEEYDNKIADLTTDLDRKADEYDVLISKYNALLDKQ